MKTFLIVLIAFVGLAGFKVVANRQINGTVYDFDKKTPIPEVQVTVLGSATNTQTDTKGNFQITVPDSKTRLVFAAKGYKPDTLLPGTRHQMNVYLELPNSIVYKVDTAEFLLSNYKITKKMSADQLLRRMEGFSVDAKGDFIYQGKTIVSVRVNGRDQLGKKASRTLRKLPAADIDKVQIVDDYGNLAMGSSIKGAEPEKILELATKGKIYGFVSDNKTKDRIPGAVVSVVGSNKSRITDSSGYYIIKQPRLSKTIQFKANGYTIQTFTIGTSNEFDVYLNKANKTGYKSDTVNYKASAYKANPAVNELLRSMKGIEVNADGSITHQGQQVTKARLNGKDYIGNSSQQASQNVPPAMLYEQVVVGYGQQVAKTEYKSAVQDKSLHEVVVNLRGNRDVNTNESYSRIVENQFKNPITTPLSTFAVDVDAASYSNVRRFINNGQLPPKNAVRIEELINYFHYDLPQPEKGNPVTIQTELAAAPWNPQHQLVRIGLKAKDVKLEKLPPSNLVFLLDVSGSMGEPNKLALVKPAMKMLVDQLRATDHVAIVVYAGDAGVKLPSTPGNEKQKIKDAIEQLNAGGSTAGGEGIKMAYQIAVQNFIKGGNNRIILATDGDFNVGPSSDKDMEQLIEDERGSGVSISILGFGMGNLKDSKMERMADKGHGNYAYIDNITEATKSMVSEFGGTLFTVAKDVKLQVEFNPGKVQAYRLLGYEDRLMAKEDFNNDNKVAGDMGVGHTVTALYEIIPVGVKDDFTNSVDPLKYQKPAETKVANTSTEIMTVKFRYKDPDSDVSKLEAVTVNDKPEAKTSDDFRFATAVAEYGMLLRDSRFKQNSQFDQLITMAKSAKGKDDDGYRAEFIRLAESTKNLMKSNEVVAAK